MNQRGGANIRSLLIQEFQKRKATQPLYTLRSFAQSLNVSPTVLSQVINQKRAISKKNAVKVCDAMKLSEDIKSQVLNAPTLSQEKNDETTRQLLKDDVFLSISKWYHHGILGLALLEKNSSNPNWIAKKLGIKPEEAQDAVERLCRLNLIQLDEGRLSCTASNTRTTTDIPSKAIRSFHKQILTLGSQALDEEPVETRDLTATVLAFKRSEMDAVKAHIKKFRRKFCAKFEKTSGADVYTLAIQFFPLTPSNKQEM